LEKRPSPGIWGGLWSAPQFLDEVAALAWCRQQIAEPLAAPLRLAPIDHAFTHFDLRLHPLWVRCPMADRVGEADRLWYSLSEPPRVGLPQPIRALFEALASAPAGSGSMAVDNGVIPGHGECVDGR
jgi:A/G-specific adenine glycosylase